MSHMIVYESPVGEQVPVHVPGIGQFVPGLPVVVPDHHAVVLLRNPNFKRLAEEPPAPRPKPAPPVPTAPKAKAKGGKR